MSSDRKLGYEVLLEITVTKRWLRQVIVALALMCRGSYLGIIEFLGVVQNRLFLGDTQTRGSSRSCGPDLGRQGYYAGEAASLSRFKPAGSAAVRSPAR
jgi:hypothetical protein